MRKRITALLLAALALLPVLVLPALADSGPKPSVYLSFRGLEGTECYATLLADRPDIGPWYVDQEYHPWLAEDGISRELFDSFQGHSVEDWYFVGLLFNCTGGKDLSWTYYPPDPFRVLLYFPKEDRWLLSEPCDRYAFASYYTADVDLTGDGSLTVTPERGREAGTFLLRLAVTLAAELLIALPFGLRKRRQLAVIAGTNVLTQLGLNLFLSAVMGGWLLRVLFLYLLAEAAVFLAEAGVYTRLLREPGLDGKRLTLYAFAANLASFLLGLCLPPSLHLL